MKLIYRSLLYATSALSISLSLYFSNIPVAAKEREYELNPLPMAGLRLLSPREYLYLRAGSEAKIIDRIFKCESGWKPDARSKQSSATGLGQFVSATWKATRLEMQREPRLELRTDPYEMIDTTIYLWDKGNGWRHWQESKGCWSY